VTPLSFAKIIGGPGSIGLLVAGSLFGLALIRLWPRNRRVGRIWLAALYITYLILALPPVASAIAAPFADDLAGRRPVEQRIDALVVFDGDNRWGRIVEAARLWSAGHPSEVVASGDPWLSTHLLYAGVPQDHLIRDQKSQTTRDQIAYLSSYLRTHPDAHAAIIASRLQMPRIAALLDRAGLKVSLYSAPLDPEPIDEALWRYLPGAGALRISRDALYERVALIYYRWRGWIDAQ